MNNECIIGVFAMADAVGAFGCPPVSMMHARTSERIIPATILFGSTAHIRKNDFGHGTTRSALNGPKRRTAREWETWPRLEEYCVVLYVRVCESAALECTHKTLNILKMCSFRSLNNFERKPFRFTVSNAEHRISGLRILLWPVLERMSGTAQPKIPTWANGWFDLNLSTYHYIHYAVGARACLRILNIIMIIN